MKTVTGILIDTVNKKESIHILNSDTLQGYYEALDCNTFDIATRKIGSKYYDIFCDDEGLFKDSPIVSAISLNGEPMLVGNLFITRTNKEGETISLTQDEINEIESNIIYLGDQNKNVWPAILCDY